jgi:hypothetical protein
VSALREKQMDHLFKGFMVIMITMCGFFLMRLVNQLDKTVENVQFIQIEQQKLSDEQAHIKDKVFEIIQKVK